MKKFLFIITFVFALYSCSNDEPDLVLQNTVNDNPVIKSEVLKEFSLGELQTLEKQLLEAGYEVPTIDVDSLNPELRGLTNILVKAIKVSCPTDHPDGSGRKINHSGVLLVPKYNILGALRSYRMIVAPPPTYTANSMAPTNMLADDFSLIDFDKFLSYWTLQAHAGFVVLIPDYPGFGDSYKQCFTPYIESRPMVRSVIDLIKAAQFTLSANNYRYKSELAITGYSQGGYVAASVARELETNSKHNLSVNLLVTGGTPCNFKQIADIIRYSDELTHTYFLPYALWAYKMNGYPQIDVSDILLEPYASNSLSFYDGTHVNINDFFPKKVSKVYTQKFLKDLDNDPRLAYINEILRENSLKPWKNKCHFVMIHGTSDNSVYYQNAKDYSELHSRNGGTVTFHPVFGNHLIGVIPYYLYASEYLSCYK